MIVRIETTRSLGITRVTARTLNAQARKAGVTFVPLTGSSTVAEARTVAQAIPGADIREIPAAALTGADKAAHTREANRALKAAKARADRKAAAAVAA